MKMYDINSKEFNCGIELNDTLKRILQEQKNRYDELSKSDLDIYVPETLDDGKVLLSEGTLIHGIGGFSIEKLESIKETGILTGQALGIVEDGETFYCADFHRIKRDISLEEYDKNFTINDGRTPLGGRGHTSLAFIIEPNDNDLYKYDCYRDTKEGNITKEFVNVDGLPVEDFSKVSSILYGIPSNQLCGIILGEKLLEQKEVVDFLIKLFPNLSIVSPRGYLIYYSGMNLDLVEEKRKSSVLAYKLLDVNNKLIKTEESLVKEKDKNRELMVSVLKNCPDEVLEVVLKEMGWQDTIDSAKRCYGVETKKL